MAVNKNSVVNITGYKFEPLVDPVDLVSVYQQKCDELELKGTMLISKNGINFSLAGTQQATETIITFLEEDNRFLNIPLKITYSKTQPFRRMKVRLKKEIISLGRKDINPKKLTGETISPQDLKNLLDNKEDVLILDTRNEYETRVGKFENAIDLNLDTFRDFPKAIESLPEDYKDKQIVMYCTGGIRCEKASAVMIKAGFADVKQLEGGVLDYFKETGGAYWEGDCFVFDERVALDTELNETEYIYCYICREPLSAEEKASPNFKLNEYCPYCIKKTV
jgi:UPF0176 protein|tara:strand:+ start:63 stop:899 length:837 start_codon:yes stop_codon:yes gene_type:complete